MALKSVGAFSVALGCLHFFFPYLLDFKSVIQLEGPPLRIFRLLFYTYQTKRTDVRGIIWLMNHHVSFVILSIGIADLLIEHWVNNIFAKYILIWMAAWWFIRAFSQFHLGKRRGDWFVFTWFSLLGVLQLLPIL